MRTLCFVLVALLIGNVAYTQVSPCNCTADAGSGNQNFSSLTWLGTGCPTGVSTSYTGNLCIDLANNTNLIMDKSFTITGEMGISNNGNSTFSIPAGITLSMTGDLGDNNNNNVTFAINGNLVVGGGIYGKNSNAFNGTGSGTGSITAGSLNFTGPPTCNPTDCSGFNWNVGTCSPAGSTFCTSVVALPVSLLFFDAQPGSEQVNLTWATATESNSSYFSIERSLDGINFREIGQENAAGNSISRINYVYNDVNPIIGRTYYRLKEVDFNGLTEYFNVEVIDYAGKKGVSVFPNPYENGELSVALNFAGSENAYGIIMDLSGKEIESFTLNSSTFKSSSLKLKSGAYFVKVYSAGHSYVSKFIVR